MPREKKFKVWDKLKREWFISPGADFWTVLSIYAAKGGGGNELEEVEFAGQRDKKGRNIYEGDIVKYWRIGYTELQIGEVRWVEYCFVIVTDKWMKKSPMLEQRELIALQGGIVEEVIGSIYENPELIKTAP